MVLGRGADLARVGHWLEVAAPVAGYIGVAIGRTIWSEALSEHQADRLEREAAITQIAANYRQMIDTYADAVVSTGGHSVHAASTA